MLSAFQNLHNRIDLNSIPFTDRGTRLLLFREGQSLYIRLAERWTKWESEVGHYRKRPPIISNWAFFDSNEQPLNFEIDSYPHVVQLSTTIGDFKWAFVDAETLLVRMPTGEFGFEFHAQGLQAQADRRGGTVHGRRNIAYTTNAQLLCNEIAPATNNEYLVRVKLNVTDGDVLLINVTPRLGFNRSLPDVDEAILAAKTRWQDWFDATPPVLPEYQAQYDYAWWVMRVGLLNTRYYFSREAMVPSKIYYVGVWHWDQFFHALAYRHIDAHLAEDQIRILLDHQLPNGMIPDAIHDEGLITHLTAPVDADVTKPPLMAWTVLKLFEKSGHLDFLQEVYEPLLRWNNWWLTENFDPATGLCIYRHPFSSGLDDSPLWDEGMPVVAPDLNTYMCLQEESLAKIAERIGLHDEATQHHARADQFAQQMRTVLWNEQEGLFDALYNGKPIDVLTPFNLLPFWTAHLPDVMLKRLLARLTDPETFWPEWPIPTVALTDKKFDGRQMWRGPTWVNINYFFIEALKRVGHDALAKELRTKTLNLIMQHPNIYEYYNPITAEAPPKAAPIFGWTSAVFIDLAIQETLAAQK